VGGGDGVDDRQAQAVAGVRVSAPRAESLEGLEQAGRGPSRVFVRRRRVVYLSGVTADVELIGAVRAALRGAAQPELARPMQAYMKSATPFLGVRVPVMRTLTRAEAKLRPFITSADLIDTVLRLWREAGYREERYAAIALLDTPAARRLRDPAVLQTLQELIVTGAWWDYVDELAHRVGDLLLSWPAEVRPAVLTWTRSDDRWLRRASIICQLGMRDRADVELLTIAIESAINDSDFFLRKAIGWALRDYARTDPAWVRSFAETRELSPLSRREALKHLS
jgi:3-methyladenine DNA glycosylase AlkD